MSRRDAGAAGQQARHAKDRLRATLGAAAPGPLGDGPLNDGQPPGGLLQDGNGDDLFEYRSHEAHPVGRSGRSGSGERNINDEGGTSARGGPALRWRLGLRLALLAGILAVLACAWFWWQAADSRPQILPLNGVSSGATSGSAAGEAEERDPGASGAGGPEAEAGPPGPLVVVHVAGAVARPGIVQLPAGSRVHDAIAAAGGGTPGAGLDRLNLALVLEDGRKIYVPGPGEDLPLGSGSDGQAAAGAGAGPGTATGTGPGAKINLNTAGVEELDALPKVGPVLAQRIVDWRKEHGPFKSVEEVDAVDGVGPKMLEALLPLLTV